MSRFVVNEILMDLCVISGFLQDLSRLGRDLREVVIIDNSPQSYIFHPDNAVSRKREREGRREGEIVDEWWEERVDCS